MYLYHTYCSVQDHRLAVGTQYCKTDNGRTTGQEKGEERDQGQVGYGGLCPHHGTRWGAKEKGVIVGTVLFIVTRAPSRQERDKTHEERDISSPPLLLLLLFSVSGSSVARSLAAPDTK